MNKPPDLLPRIARGPLELNLRVQPVVVVMGARQTGKSTLAQTHPDLENHRYVTLDDVENRALASRSPADLLALSDRLILDEVQRAPDVLLAIKMAVDRDRPRRPGRFFLTGSANLLLMQRVSESLAGRSGYVLLWPLTRRERLGLARPGLWDLLLDNPAKRWLEIVSEERLQPADWRSECLRGGYPTPAHELDHPEDRSLWFTGYVRTYLERDLQDLSTIDNLVDFQRVMRAVCLRIGNLVNQSELGRDVGVSQPTIHRWLNLLETSFQLIRVEPYAINRTKRLVKSPKLYWSDTGLALHLSAGEPTGAHLENMVLADLIAWRETRTDRPGILFWRTRGGEEIDFVIETKRGLLAVEIKSSRRPSSRDGINLRSFRNEYRDLFLGGLLLHDGDATEPLGESILSAPWWKIL